MTKQGLLTTFPHNDLGPHFPENHSISQKNTEYYMLPEIKDACKFQKNALWYTLPLFQVPPKLLCRRIKRILSLESSFTVSPLWLDSYLRLLTQTHSQ